MKEDIEYMKKELEEQTLIMGLLQDMKLMNKHLYNILIVVILLWFATIAGFVYYINTYGISETVECVETDY